MQGPGNNISEISRKSVKVMYTFSSAFVYARGCNPEEPRDVIIERVRESVFLFPSYSVSVRLRGLGVSPARPSRLGVSWQLSAICHESNLL